jgi:hypothetical protein
MRLRSRRAEQGTGELQGIDSLSCAQCPLANYRQQAHTLPRFSALFCISPNHDFGPREIGRHSQRAFEPVSLRGVSFSPAQSSRVKKTSSRDPSPPATPSPPSLTDHGMAPASATSHGPGANACPG